MDLCRRLVLVVGLLSAPALAQQPPPATYPQAERVFETALTVEDRVLFQLLLTAAGYLNAVPSEEFTQRIFAAIQRFQRENGFRPDGILTGEQAERIAAIALAKHSEWGFREVSHPTRGHPIWIPLGLDLVPERTKSGLVFKEPQDRLSLSYNFFPNVTLKASYESLLKKFTDRGETVHYSVMRPDFFVISKTSPEGVDAYIRYHTDGDGILGFSLFWNNAAGVVSGERVAILMSGSLRAAMTGARFAHPPVGDQVARKEPPRNEARPKDPDTTGSTEVPRSPNQDRNQENGTFTTGTGYFINREGYVVTNNHVVENCSVVRVKSTTGRDQSASVFTRDTKNDLALVKTSIRGAKPVAIRIGARLGEQVAAFGFPHADFLATSGNFTMGNITGLVGIKDDTSQLQMSAPIHAGNSGGPLLDMSGNVVGTVVAKIGMKMAEVTGDIPQLLGFAVKAPILAAFLDSNGVAYSTGTLGNRMDTAEAVDSRTFLCERASPNNLQ